jgi:hypothetical protein
MPKADAHTTTHPSSDLTLTNFAAALGELEPPRRDDDLEAAQFGRRLGLRRVGRFPPVSPAVGAAHAFSLAHGVQTDLLDNEFSKKEWEDAIESANGILEEPVGSLMPGHGIMPLRSCCQPNVTTLEPLSEAAE